MEHGSLIPILLLALVAIGSLVVTRRLRLPVILAWLVTGGLAGSQGFNWLESGQIALVAEIGIVFLMFSLGLEFSLPRLWAMRARVFGLGSAQVLITLLCTSLLSWLLGLDVRAAFVCGGAIALSSTAIVLKQLDERGWINRRHGELSVSILLFQDLAVIPLLIVIPLLGSDSSGAVLAMELSWALLKGAAAFVLLLGLGGFLLPKIFDEVARSRSDELFVLTTLAVALATGFVTLSLGLSMTLGAFLAGMLLGESQYRQQLEADIRPFRDLLMGLFFVSVGMLLDLSLLWAQLPLLLALVVTVMLSKAAIIWALAGLSGEKAKDALATGICLAQVGEFSFVLIALAVKWQVLERDLANLLVMTGIFSMALTPTLVDRCLDLAKQVLGQREQWLGDEPPQPELVTRDHVVLLGYGRVGQTIARFLKREKMPFVAVDLDPIRVREARTGGEPVVFGDGRRQAILKDVGLPHARLVVVTFDNRRDIFNLLDCIKGLAPSIRTLVRTRDDSTLEALELAGADQVIPESLEGSLMLVSQVLYQLGVPLPRILLRIERERRDRYRILHGFFGGEDLAPGRELLHAVTLSPNAWAVGHFVVELPLNHWRVKLDGIKRDGEALSFVPTTRLAHGDTLLLLGTPHQVELAERALLEGP
ncbi:MULTISPECIES: monovalent cation:proton antiporter family protein [Ferrimonas]|uniref:monovalent cation:proton antiporter family protein n=1 Tax=Ferrimonas TaxID=44011 RepID=UPI0004024BC2|nr:MULTISPECIES: monovalent cation:proton antiporter family protein [Ferrimonas]USD36757.1 cation:proton antiporter [Ferrimonas sp. SCSIO 43195]